MHADQNIETVYKKLKSSPYWRDDFTVEEIEDIKGIKVYRIKTNDQDPSTILAILNLNKVLQE